MSEPLSEKLERITREIVGTRPGGRSKRIDCVICGDTGWEYVTDGVRACPNGCKAPPPAMRVRTSAPPTKRGTF